MNDNDEQVYYASEVLNVLIGLTYLYKSKPWWSRWLWRKWYDALMTAALQLCGPELLAQYERQEAVKAAEDILGE